MNEQNKHEKLIREIAEEMAKEHNEGIGVAQTGVIQVEWWYKHARIAIKRMAEAVRKCRLHGEASSFDPVDCDNYLAYMGLISSPAEGDGKYDK